MKLGFHKGTKLVEPDFSGKFVFGQKGPKNEVFGIFLKIASLLFSDFGPELEKFKGPIKLLLSVSQSVSLCVCHAEFSVTTHRIFLIFSIKLGDHR